MKTVTASLRAEAALACAMMASSTARDMPEMVAYDTGDLPLRKPAISLARKARDAVFVYSGRFETMRELWAEAEALLLDGWCPGDEIVVVTVEVDRSNPPVLIPKLASSDLVQTTNEHTFADTTGTFADTTGTFADTTGTFSGPVNGTPALEALEEKILAPAESDVEREVVVSQRDGLEYDPFEDS